MRRYRLNCAALTWFREGVSRGRSADSVAAEYGVDACALADREAGTRGKDCVQGSPRPGG